MKKIFITLFVIISIIFVNIFNLQAFWQSKKAKNFYEQKQYLKALEIYKKLDNKNNYFNIWDVLYKLGEQQKDLEKKLAYWEKSLEFFLKAMKQNYTLKAEFNYNFVKKKIEELKKKIQEEQKKKEEKQNKKQNKQNFQDNKENQNKSKENEEKQNNKNSDSKNSKNLKQNSKNKQDSQNKQWNNNKNSKEQKNWKQNNKN